MHQSNCGLYGHGSYLNYITDLCFGIDTDSLLIMSASVVYQNDWHAGMHWRNCISNLHRLIFVKLNMPFTKVCVSLYLSPHSISCVQPFHSSLFLPLLLIVVLLMDEPSVIRSLPFMLGLFLAPRVPGWGDVWKWGLGGEWGESVVSVCRFWQRKNERRLKGCYSFNITVVTGTNKGDIHGNWSICVRERLKFS